MDAPKPQPFSEAPTCNCALLCDDVTVSVAGGKHTLNGIIGQVFVAEMPAIIGNDVCYVRLSNVYPSQVVKVGLENAATGEDVFAFTAKLPEKSDPLGVYTIVQKIGAFRVEQSGRYMFTASSDGIPLAQSPIIIVGPKEEEPHEAD